MSDDLKRARRALKRRIVEQLPYLSIETIEQINILISLQNIEAEAAQQKSIGLLAAATVKPRKFEEPK